MFQGFEWYTPPDQHHWHRLKHAIPQLRATGIDNIWIPPGCKAGTPGSNGYNIYDLYDLGEFDQKGSRATKWGSKRELLEMAKTANDSGIGIYWDTILNHRCSADYSERCQAVVCDPIGMHTISCRDVRVVRPVITDRTRQDEGDRKANGGGSLDWVRQPKCAYL